MIRAAVIAASIGASACRMTPWHPEPPHPLDDAASVGAAPSPRRQGYRRPVSVRHDVRFADLPEAEPVRHEQSAPHLRVIDTDEPSGHEYVLAGADGIVGTLQAGEHLTHTPHLRRSTDGPTCAPGRGVAAARFVGIRRSEWTASRARLAFAAGDLDLATCAFQPRSTSDLVATAVVPGLLYAGRRTETAGRARLLLVFPSAPWVATDPLPDKGATVIDGLFTWVELPVERGGAAAVVAQIAERNLAAWKRVLRGADEVVDPAGFSDQEGFLELGVDVTWGRLEPEPTVSARVGVTNTTLVPSDARAFAREE